MGLHLARGLRALARPSSELGRGSPCAHAHNARSALDQRDHRA
jgi:hypothetical protein